MPEEMIALTSAGLFPTEITNDIFSTVKEESVLAQLAQSEPIPYVGKTEWVMSMGGEASVVDEGAAKPVGDAQVTPYVIKPFKVVYQMRITDEFLKMADEQRIPYMDAFKDGFAKTLRKAYDFVAFHGCDPASEKKLSFKENSFDYRVGAADGFVQVTEQKPIDAALKQAIDLAGDDINGIILTSKGAELMGAITKENGDYRYPQFDFAFPDEFAAAKCVKSDVLGWEYTMDDPESPDNPKLVEREDYALVGNFNAFKWGYAQDVEFDIIDSGDPDGQGDLKRYNQIVLRAEAYIGFGILNQSEFAIVGTQQDVESE